MRRGGEPFKPQTVLLRGKASAGAGVPLATASTLKEWFRRTSVRPRRKRKDRSFGLDWEKVFSPGRNFRAKD